MKEHERYLVEIQYDQTKSWLDTPYTVTIIDKEYYTTVDFTHACFLWSGKRWARKKIKRLLSNKRRSFTSHYQMTDECDLKKIT